MAPPSDRTFGEPIFPIHELPLAVSQCDKRSRASKGKTLAPLDAVSTSWEGGIGLTSHASLLEW